MPRHIRVEPGTQRRERRMGQVALKISPYPRLEREVMGLSVAFPQAREDAENLGIPLCPEDLVMGAEQRAILYL
jgi:hypothetical protein